MSTGELQSDTHQALRGEVPPALLVRGLSFAYATPSGPVPVLHNVSLTLNKGEWIALMGPSGSGKSTALLCSAGLLSAETGTIELTGPNIREASDRELTRLRRDRIGFVFQDFNLIVALTARQNVALPANFGGHHRSRKEIILALEKVGLANKVNVLPDSLSGGERQRIAIARALVSNPAVVFADEPTGSLDIRSGDQVLAQFQSLVDFGSAILMVTHDPRVASRADRVVLLQDGHVAGEMVGASAEKIAPRLASLEDVDE